MNPLFFSVNKRKSRAPRHEHRPARGRLLLALWLLGVSGATAATLTWTGGGGDGAWHNPTNWTGATLPGPADDVVINLAGASVNFSQGTATVSSVTCARPFTVSGGLLTVTTSFTLNSTAFTLAGGTLAVINLSALNNSSAFLQGGAIVGQLRLINASLVFATNATTTGTIVVNGSANMLGGDMPSTAVLHIQGNSSYGNPAALTVTNSAVNRGTIKLETTTSGYTSSLSIGAGAVLVNTTNGIIRANLGANGPNVLAGEMENWGTVLVETNATLSGTGSTSRFTQKAGVVQVNGTFSPAGRFEMQGGTVQANGELITINGGSLYFQGGKLAGVVRAYNAFVAVADTVTEASTFRVVGSSGILASNGSPAVTVWIEGNSTYGNPASLTVTNSAVNRGTIRLETTSPGYSSQLSVNAGAVLVNDANAVIQANVGANGPTALLGEVENWGTVLASSNVSLSVPNRFRQMGGVVRGDGEFLKQGGSFEFYGGRLEGTVRAVNAFIAVADTVSEVSTLLAVGTSGILASNGSPAVTLWIQGNAGYGNPATLLVTNDTVNRGTIRLETITPGYSSEISVSAGAVLVNATNGIIRANPGASGPNQLVGDVDNWGMVLASSNSTLTAVNRFRQMGGVLRGDGEFLKQGGNFELYGGRLEGTVRAYNAFIAVADTVSAASTLRVVGTSGILASNASLAVTLWIDGNAGYGNPGRLTVTNNAVNRGTIQLEATTPGGYSSDLSINAGAVLINATNGMIRANAGAGGLRSVTGDVDNLGTMLAGSNSTLSVANRLRQMGGVLRGDGEFVKQGGVFEFSGGRLEGTVRANSSFLSIASTVSEVSTLRAVGTSGVLASNGSPVVTLWIEGNPSFGNPGRLTVTNNTVNRGTIRLETLTVGGYSSDLSAGTGAVFINATNGTIQVNAGADGPRSLTGSFTNQGKLVLDGATLNLGTGPFVNDLSGSISGTGTLSASGISFLNHGVVSPGASPGILTFNGNFVQSAAGRLNIEINGLTVGTEYDRLAISGAATLNGALNVTLPEDYLPAISNTFRVLTFTSRSGDFATYNGLAFYTNRAFTANYLATALDLVTVTATNQTPSAPSIVVQPANQTVINGQSANFGVTASGTRPFSYQWRFKGTNLASATAATLALSNVQTNQAGNYQVVVTNLGGAATSAVAVLTVVPIADLVLTDLAVPTNALAGQPVQLSWRSLNQGSQTALAPWTESVGLATNSSGTPEISLGALTVQSNLAAGQSLVRTQTVNLPGGLDGQFFWVFHTDTGNQVFEDLNETNNLTVSVLPVRVRAPDLKPVQVSPASPSATLGQSLGVSWISTNAGSAPVSAAWSDRVYLGTNSASLANALPLAIASATNVPLAALGRATNSANVTLPLSASWPPGNYYLLVSVDYANGVAEFNETNNVLAAPVTLTLPPLPDLAASNVLAPSNAAPGQIISLAWGITNRGSLSATGAWSETIYLATNNGSGTGVPPVPPGAVEVATFAYTNTLSPGASISRTQNVIVPFASPVGNTWFAVLADSRDEIFEGNETNNLGVAVGTTAIPAVLTLELSAAQISEGAPQPLQAMVTRNGSPASSLMVTITNGKPAELSAPASVVIAAGQASASFNLFALPDGIVDGPQAVTIGAAANAFAPASANVTVLDTNLPTLTISLRTNVVIEGNIVTATISRDAATNDAVAVLVASSSPAHLLAPSTVTIAAGEYSNSVALLAPNDFLIEPQTACTVTVSAGGYIGGTTNLTVLDDDTPQLILDLASSTVSEGAGPQATLATILRAPVTSRSLTLLLQSSNTSAALVPATVTIPANAASVSFPVAAVNNGLVDGNKLTLIRSWILASGTSTVLANGPSALLTVTDDDGPALQLTLARDLVAEGLNPATTGTVSRNTSTNAALLVALSSSATNKATVPATVTIPAGAASANFNVISVDDGMADGNTRVTITASASSFASGVAQLTVSDVTKPDLVVAAITAPATADTEAFVNLGFQIRNQGVAAMAATSIVQRVFLARDAVLGNDTLLGEFSFTGGVGVNQQFSQSFNLQMPQAAGDYWVIVQADATNGVAEILEDNNTRISAAPIHVTAAYDATVATALTTALANTPVPLTGHAFKPGNSPAPFVLVNIHINVRGTHRVVSTTTDAAGNFALPWQPLPGEAGLYQIGAAHPGESNAPAQDSFTLFGLSATPSFATITVPESGSVTGVVAVVNDGDVALTGLTAQVLSNAPNLTVTAMLNTNVLAGLGTNVLTCVVSAANASVLESLAPVRITTAQGATLDVPLVISVAELLPRLVATPGELVQGFKRGVQTMINFQVVNAGGAASGPVAVSLPNVSWISLASPNPLPSLAPGGTNVVSLQLTPPGDLPFGNYTGSLFLGAGDAVTGVPFQLRSLSDAKGDLRVIAEDELTYYAAGAPHVTNANVTVKDVLSGAVVTNGVTGANGELFVPQIPEGYYSVEVRAEKHTSDLGTHLIVAGVTNDAVAFLSRQTVRYTWTVVPTEVQDRYHIVIESSFETDVPLPVVTVEPPVIDLATMHGNQMQVDLTVENHGLVNANNFRFEFDPHPCFTFTPLVEKVNPIPAHAKLVIPLIIKRTGLCTNFPPPPVPPPVPPPNPPDGGGGDGGNGSSCVARGRAIYEIPCKNQTSGIVAPIDFPNAGDCPGGGVDYVYRGGSCTCPGGNSGFTGGGSSGGGGGGGGGGGTGRGGGHVGNLGPGFYPSTPPVSCKPNCDGTVTTNVPPPWWKCAIGDLNPFHNQGSPAIKCLALVPGLGCPAGLWDCGHNFAPGNTGSLGSKIGGCLLGVGQSCLDISPPVPLLDDLSGGKDCLDGIAPCFNPPPASVPALGRTAIGVASSSDPVTTFWPAYLNHLAIFEELTGTNSAIWLNGLSGANTGNWFARFRLAALDASESGAMISANERASLLTGTQPPGVASTEVNRFLDRWNRSQTNWALNIFRPADAPPGANLDFMDATALRDKIQLAGTFYSLAKDAGFANPIHAILQTIGTWLVQNLGQEGGVCASVRLRLDQDAVLAREAFRATLEFNNGESAPLMNISAALSVLDSRGVEATSLFGLPAPELSGLSAVDGSGTLASNGVAMIGWTLVPTVDAAPSAPVKYFVSGKLTYSLNGTLINVPLAPVGITVHPTARLDVKYFHQRDVFSDDPFTEIVELTIPYSLAVMVRNKGAGTAKNFRITSAQPKIVDNEKGLLIGFKIISTEVAGQGVTPSLTADFGNLAPGTNVIARWLLTSSLQGSFADYEATFEHLDDLGNARLSLIDSVSIHEMNHVVQAGGPFADGKPDFLVNDIPDPLDLPDTIYLSDGSTGRVHIVASATITGTLSPGNLSVQLSAQLPGGWAHLIVPDPANGQYRLVSVVRSDSTVIPVGDNAWITDRTFLGLGKQPLRENILHLLDYNSPGTYTLTYALNAPADTTPPTSAVAALPAQSSSGIVLNWSGVDDVGISFFDIYTSENGGPFSRWLANSIVHSAIYQGNLGSNYAFYSVAVDQAGNREAAPATPDAQTTVTHTNHAPVLAAITNRTLVEGETLSVALEVSDADGDNVSLSLGAGAPAGVLLSSQTHSLTWVTGEAHGPSTNSLSVIARDNGIPQLSVTQSFTVIVRETNSPPSLAPIANRKINEGQLLAFNASASDNDLPPQTLAFSLVNPPLGAAIGSSSGRFTWTPNDTQGGATNVLKVVVTDNGPPSQSATQSFSVVVVDTQPDFVLNIGTTQLLAGASAEVPFRLQTGLDLTNVQWVLAVSNDRLVNPTLQNLATEVGAAELQPLGANRYFARFASRADTLLQGNLLLARLAFDTGTNEHSAVAQLNVESLAGSRASAAAPVNVAGGAGRVFIVGLEPVLDARATNHELRLAVFGKPGSSFQLTYKTNMLDHDWQLAFRAPQTNLVQEIGIPTTLPKAFYRAEDFAPDPPVLELRGLTGTDVPLLVYGRRGSNYILEATGDLSGKNGWFVVTNAASSNAFNFFGPGRGANNVWLFRVRRP